MTVLGLVWGIVLVGGGLLLGRYAWRGFRTRPGWDRMYGPGALLLLLAGFAVIFGLLNLRLALE